MKKTTLLLAGLILMIAAKANAYADEDFQVWNTDVEEMAISKNLTLAAEQEFRWGNNASDFFYQHYDAGIFYRVNKYWNVGGGYRHILSKSNGDFKVENAPYLSATASWEFAGLKFDDRSRFEYEHFDYQPDNGRYRNKFTAKMPWKFTRLGIQPFLSEEIFIRFLQADPFNQNRFSAGLGLNLTKNAKAELYYMRVSTKNANKWTDSNVLGSKLKIAF